MNSFIAIFALVALAQAGPIDIGRVQVEEDTLGNYKLNYHTDTASRTEQRFDDGRVIGSYSFVDTDGVKHTVNYVAGAHQGFGAQSADIPRAPHKIVYDVPETPEVIHARREHLDLVNMARALGLHEDRPVPAAHVLPHLSELPQIATLPASFVPPVDADHYHAREQLLSSYAQALRRLAEEYKRF